MNALKTNKFKVGDEVEIVSLQGTDGIGDRGECNVMIGETGVVTDVGVGEMPYAVEKNNKTWFWSENNLKLVNEEINDSQNESIDMFFESDVLLPKNDEDDFTCCLGKGIESKPHNPLIAKEGIKSDGGSSDYYFTELPQELIDQIVETGGIEIKDIARYVYDNNADAFNIIKAQKRIIEANKGVGKAGITKLYDANKIVYFANEQYEAIKREGNNE